jgi:hypothetical protein
VRKVKLVSVRIKDTLKAGLGRELLGRIFLARERAPGVYRVNDGTYDFNVTEVDLENEEWVEQVHEEAPKWL